MGHKQVDPPVRIGSGREASAPALQVTDIDHVVLTVTDVELATQWYERVLGMRRRLSEPATGGPVRTSVSFGQTELTLRTATGRNDRSGEAVGGLSICLLTRSSPSEVIEHLLACGVEVVTGPVMRQGATSDLLSVYTQDPDGNRIEISSSL